MADFDKLKKIVCDNKPISIDHLKQLSEKLKGDTYKSSTINDLPKLLPVVFKYAFHEDDKYREAAIPAYIELASLLDLNKHLKDKPWWSTMKEEMVLKSSDTLMQLVAQGDCNWAVLWSTTVTMLGTDLRFELPVLNKLLKVVEKAFKINNEMTRSQGFDCWCKMIDNFAIIKQELNNKRRLNLLVIPLRANNHNTPKLCKMKMETWKHLLSKIDQHNEMTIQLLITHFLEFMFGGVGTTPPICKTLGAECADIFLQLLKTSELFRVLPELFVKDSLVCIEHVKENLTLSLSVWEGLLNNLKGVQWTDTLVVELMTSLTKAVESDKQDKNKTWALIVHSLYSGHHSLPSGLLVKNCKTVISLALEPHVLIHFSEPWCNDLVDIIAQVDPGLLPENILGDIVSKLAVLSASEMFKDKKLKCLRGIWMMVTNILCKWIADDGQGGKNESVQKEMHNAHQLLLLGAAELSSMWNKHQMKAWKSLYSECVKYFSLVPDALCDNFVSNLVLLLLEEVNSLKIPLHVAVDIVCIILEFHLSKDVSSFLPLMIKIAESGLNNEKSQDVSGNTAAVNQYLKAIVTAARSEPTLINDVLTVIDKMLKSVEDMPSLTFGKTKNMILKAQHQLQALKPSRVQDKSDSPNTSQVQAASSPTMTSFLHRLAKAKETKAKMSSPTPSQASDVSSSPVHTPNLKKSTSPFADLKSEDFVFVPPKTRKTILTDHQRESLVKRKHDIPALYQDLSQDSSQSAFESIMAGIQDVAENVDKLHRLDSPIKQNRPCEEGLKISSPLRASSNCTADIEHNSAKSEGGLINNKENDCLNNNTKSNLTPLPGELEIKECKINKDLKINSSENLNVSSNPTSRSLRVKKSDNIVHSPINKSNSDISGCDVQDKLQSNEGTRSIGIDTNTDPKDCFNNNTKSNLTPLPGELESKECKKNKDLKINSSENLNVRSNPIRSLRANKSESIVPSPINKSSLDISGCDVQDKLQSDEGIRCIGNDTNKNPNYISESESQVNSNQSTPKRKYKKNKLIISVKKSVNNKNYNNSKDGTGIISPSQSEIKSSSNDNTPKISPRRLRKRKSGITPILSAGKFVKKTMLSEKQNSSSKTSTPQISNKSPKSKISPLNQNKSIASEIKNQPLVITIESGTDICNESRITEKSVELSKSEEKSNIKGESNKTTHEKLVEDDELSPDSVPCSPDEMVLSEQNEELSADTVSCSPVNAVLSKVLDTGITKSKTRGRMDSEKQRMHINKQQTNDCTKVSDKKSQTFQNKDDSFGLSRNNTTLACETVNTVEVTRTDSIMKRKVSISKINEHSQIEEIPAESSNVTTKSTDQNKSVDKIVIPKAESVVHQTELSCDENKNIDNQESNIKNFENSQLGQEKLQSKEDCYRIESEPTDGKNESVESCHLLLKDNQKSSVGQTHVSSKSINNFSPNKLNAVGYKTCLIVSVEKMTFDPDVKSPQPTYMSGEIGQVTPTKDTSSFRKTRQTRSNTESKTDSYLEMNESLKNIPISSKSTPDIMNRAINPSVVENTADKLCSPQTRSSQNTYEANKHLTDLRVSGLCEVPGQLQDSSPKAMNSETEKCSKSITTQPSCSLTKQYHSPITNNTMDINFSLSQTTPFNNTPVKSGQKTLKQTQLPFTPIRKSVGAELKELKKCSAVNNEREHLQSNQTDSSSKAADTLSVTEDSNPDIVTNFDTTKEPPRTPDKSEVPISHTNITEIGPSEESVVESPDSKFVNDLTESEDIIASSQENDLSLRSLVVLERLTSPVSKSPIKYLSKSPNKQDIGQSSSDRILRSSPMKLDGPRFTGTPLKKSVCRRLDVEIDDNADNDHRTSSPLIRKSEKTNTPAKLSTDFSGEMFPDIKLLNGDAKLEHTDISTKASDNNLTANDKEETDTFTKFVEENEARSPCKNLKHSIEEPGFNIESPKRSLRCFKFDINDSPKSPSSRTNQMMELAMQDKEKTISSPVSSLKKRRILPTRLGPVPRTPQNQSNNIIHRTHNGPSEEWIRRTYSPTASPNSSILKRKVDAQPVSPDSSPPSIKKKRVSFLDPPVSESLLFSKAVPGKGKIQRPESKQDTESEEIPTQGSVELDQGCMSSQPASKIYSPLKLCSNPLTDVIERTVSLPWATELESQLERLGVLTIGQLSSLTEETIERLPFIPPKIERLRKILQNYYNEINAKPDLTKGEDIDMDLEGCVTPAEMSKNPEVSETQEETSNEMETDVGPTESVSCIADRIKCDIELNPGLISELGNKLDIDIIMSILKCAVTNLKKEDDKS